MSWKSCGFLFEFQRISGKPITENHSEVWIWWFKARHSGEALGFFISSHGFFLWFQSQDWDTAIWQAEGPCPTSLWCSNGWGKLHMAGGSPLAHWMVNLSWKIHPSIAGWVIWGYPYDELETSISSHIIPYHLEIPSRNGWFIWEYPYDSGNLPIVDPREDHRWHDQEKGPTPTLRSKICKLIPDHWKCSWITLSFRDVQGNLRCVFAVDADPRFSNFSSFWPSEKHKFWPIFFEKFDPGHPCHGASSAVERSPFSSSLLAPCQVNFLADGEPVQQEVPVHNWDGDITKMFVIPLPASLAHQHQQHHHQHFHTMVAVIGALTGLGSAEFGPDWIAESRVCPGHRRDIARKGRWSWQEISLFLRR